MTYKPSFEYSTINNNTIYESDWGRTFTLDEAREYAAGLLGAIGGLEQEILAEEARDVALLTEGAGLSTADAQRALKALKENGWGKY